jgi:glycoside/pentoside/hexuronide:cation symporter, GPH family
VSPPSADARLTWAQITGWSVGTLGPVTLLYLVNYAFMFFMTDLLGVSAALAGVLIFSVRLYDMFADPLIGTISDHTATRMGRRRPWMLAGAIVTVMGCITLFIVPDTLTGRSAASPLIWWVLGALVAFYTGYSMFNVPYMAMPAEMTDSFAARTRLMSVRVFFIAVAGLLGVWAVPLLIGSLGSDKAAYARTAIIMGTLALAAMLLCVFATAGARATQRTNVHVAMIDQFRIALGNRPFLILIGAKLLLLLSMSSMTTTMFYFFVHVLDGNLKMLSQFGLLQAVGTLVSPPLWVKISSGRQKQHVFMLAITGSTVVLLSLLLAGPGEPVTLLLLRGAVLGVFAGGALLMGQSLLPDTMEYDYRRSGLRREGIFSGVYSMAEKAGFAVGPLLLGILLGSAGYNPTRAATVVHSTEGVARAVYLGVSVIPSVASLLCVALLSGYNLTEARLKAIVAPIPPPG